MKKLTRQEKHEQCMREIRGTLIVVLICCAWHIASAFLLNGTGLYFLGMQKYRRLLLWRIKVVTR